MTRGIFGWDLPPGVSLRDIEAAMGDDEERCEVCGAPAYDCVCPECPRCGVQGDPACYERHGMTRTLKQIERMQKARSEDE